MAYFEHSTDYITMNREKKELLLKLKNGETSPTMSFELDNFLKVTDPKLWFQVKGL
jgi:hypothetical protein